jgi:hypothetical protein
MEEDEKNMVRQERWDDCFVCCVNSFLHLTPMVCVPLALIICTAIVAVFVDQSSSISLGAAFVPLYVVMAALAIIFVWFESLTFCLISQFMFLNFDCRFSRSLCWSRSKERNWYYQTESVVKEFCLETMLGARTWSSYALSVIAFAGVLLTIIFIHLRVTTQISWSWTFVFLPLWIAMSTVCCMVPAQCSSDDEDDLPIWQFVAIIAISPLLVFTILLVLRLNGSDIPLKHVHILFQFIFPWLLCSDHKVCTGIHSVVAVRLRFGDCVLGGNCQLVQGFI